MNENLIGNKNNIIFYEDSKVEVVLKEDNVWLNTNAIANLFNVQRPSIVKHINNIYNDEKLDKNLTISKMEIVRNKLHYAITGKTVAELIYERVDIKKAHMGLTNWKNSPDGLIYKTVFRLC